MGLHYVLLDEPATSFFVLYLVLLADDLDAPAAAGIRWLHDEQILEIIHFAVIVPAFEILRKNVGGRTDVKLFALLSSLLLHIPPQV